MRSKFKSRNKGIAFIEIIIAIAIFAIAVVPIGKFFLDSFEFQNRNQKVAHANSIAEYVIETFKSGLLQEVINEGEYETTLGDIYDKLGIDRNTEFGYRDG